MQIFLGIRPKLPEITRLHPSLKAEGERWRSLCEHSHHFKITSKRYDADLVRQVPQSRLALMAINLHAGVHAEPAGYAGSAW